MYFADVRGSMPDLVQAVGRWIGNQRSRAATLSPERVEQLAAIGMR
ncbi:helicase associated domain-containing protein [Streptomyces murinus]